MCEHVFTDGVRTHKILKMLLSDAATGVRVARDVVDSSDSAAIVRQAEKNDVDRSLYWRILKIAPDRAEAFVPPPDDGGRAGFSNASTDDLHQVGRRILESAPKGARITAVKGYSLSRMYPKHLRRQQNDIDIAVDGLGSLIDLFSVLRNLRFEPRILAARIGENYTLEGSLSARKVDLVRRVITWCDVWIGAQPFSLHEVRLLEPDFWQAMLSDHVGREYKVHTLLNLLGEIHERSQVRIRDLIDFWSVLEAGPGEESLEVLQELQGRSALASAVVALSAVFSDPFETAFPGSFRRAVEWAPSPISVEHSLALPYRCAAAVRGGLAQSEEVPLRDRLFSPELVRFYALSREAGPLAVTTKLNRLLLRTPVGTFVSEDQMENA